MTGIDDGRTDRREMSAGSEKFHHTLVDQLASLEDRLEGKADDVEMLAEIQAGIRALLASGDSSESEIRVVPR